MYSSSSETPADRSGAKPGRKGLENLLPARIAARPTLTPVPRQVTPVVARAPGLPDLMRAIRRRLGIALALATLIAVPAAGLVWRFGPRPTYYSRSLLQMSSTRPKIVFETMDAAGPVNGEFAAYQQTQTALIKSRTVLAAALNDPEVTALAPVVVASDPVTWLGQRLEVSFVGEVCTIGLTGENPGQVIALVNSVTDAYLANVVNVERTQRQTRVEALQKTYETYQERLKQRRDNLRRLASTAGSNDKETLAFKQKLEIQRLMDTEQELARVRNQVRLLRAKMKVILASGGLDERDRPLSAESRSALEVAVDQDPGVQALQTQVQQWEGRLAASERLARIPNTDPTLRRARAELTSATAALERLRSQRYSQLVGQYRSAVPKPHAHDPFEDASDPSSIAQELDVYESLEQELVAEVAKLGDAAQSLNQTTLDLETEQDAILHAENACTRIGAEVEALKVELDAPPRIRLVEKAQEAEPQGQKKRLLAAAGAGGLGFALVVLGVGWLDARGRRVSHADEVVAGLGLNLLGVLPALADRPRRSLRNREDTTSQFDEFLIHSINATRALVLHALKSQGIQVLMVASALKGEGKSSLCCHLATSLARAGRRTLLVDCDLRCPTAHLLLDQPQSPGLCELLRDEVELDQVLRPTQVPGLNLIAAGVHDHAVVEAIARGQLQTILDELRGQFDYIIIDSAPVLAVSDTLYLAQHADAALFSVLRDVSRLPKLESAYEILRRFGIPILGAVVAGANARDSHHVYGSADRRDTPGG